MLDQDIEKQLRYFSPFNDMDAEYLRQFAPHVEIVEEKAGKLIFRRGKRAEFQYFLISGQVELIGEMFTSETVDASTTRSQYTLCDSIPTRVSAVAKSPVSLLKVNSDFLDLMLAIKESPEKEHAETASLSSLEATPQSEMTVELLENDWMGALLQSPLLRSVPSANLQKLFSRFEKVAAKKGDVIIKEGSEGDYFYVIDQGQARISYLSSPETFTIQAGSSFGEEALVSQSVRNASVTMMTDGVLRRLGKQDFNRLLCAPLERPITLDALVSRAQPYVLLDVRTVLEYRMQHSEGAVNLPLSRLRKLISGLDREKLYVVSPEAGRRSHLASYLLTQFGFDCRLLQATDQQDRHLKAV